MKQRQRGGAEREDLDECIEADQERRPRLASLFEREEREQDERRHEPVALGVLHREQHFQIDERQGRSRLAVGEQAPHGVPEQQRVEETPDQERRREWQRRKGGEQQRERRAVLVEVEVLVGVGGVQIAVRQQGHRRGAEHLEVVGATDDSLLHRDEHGAGDVQGEDRVAGGARPPGSGGGKSPPVPREGAGGGVWGGAGGRGGGGAARDTAPPT